MLKNIKEASDYLNVHPNTLRRWEKEGKIKVERTEGGHRRYDIDSLNPYSKYSKEENKKTLIYARVSTSNRKDDLERQIQVLELYCASHGWQYEILQDIGSGLNYSKKGLLSLIKLIETNKIERIVLNYKDRLLRFGSEIIFEICKYHGVEVVILSDTEVKDYNQELVEDVLSVITVFSARLYGSRSHRNKKITDENKKLFKEGDSNEEEIFSTETDKNN